jgi:pyridoxal phosphate enzyme (YggS family)
MSEINEKISKTFLSVKETLLLRNKSEDSVKIIAVSKKKSKELISEAYRCGIKNFGENYLQEALEKKESLKGKKIIWHFIGSIQSNKCKEIAENFDWVHTVDRIKTARLLSKYCPKDKTINILIQINIDCEESKSGVLEEDLMDLAKEIDSLNNLILKGIMVIPKNDTSEELLKNSFNKTFLLSKKLQSKLIDADEISMGMTNDYKLAIESGSTMIRIGTGIFGERN